MFKILNKTGLYLNTPRVNIDIYRYELNGTPFYHSNCNRVSLLLAIRICKTCGVNLQRLAKKYYKRKNQPESWLNVEQKLKFADKIIISDAKTDDLLLVIDKKSS